MNRVFHALRVAVILAAGVGSDTVFAAQIGAPDAVGTVPPIGPGFRADTGARDDQPPPKKPQFRDVEIEKPFDKYLRADPFVMDLAGAILIDAGKDGWLLIGVGKTVLRDGSAEDLLRAEKVCTLKARAAAIGERDGSRITYLKHVEDRVVVEKDADGKETVTTVSERLKVTREKVEGVAKNLPVVGRWRSGDGMVFFLAVGGKVPPELHTRRKPSP